jgi:hypothetical protein
MLHGQLRLESRHPTAALLAPAPGVTATELSSACLRFTPRTRSPSRTVTSGGVPGPVSVSQTPSLYPAGFVHHMLCHKARNHGLPRIMRLNMPKTRSLTPPHSSLTCHTSRLMAPDAREAACTPNGTKGHGPLL